jgi:hypothetical protein
MNRSDLEIMMAAQADPNAMLSAGKVKLDGNSNVLTDLRSVVVEFNPFRSCPALSPVRMS